MVSTRQQVPVLYLCLIHAIAVEQKVYELIHCCIGRNMHLLTPNSRGKGWEKWCLIFFHDEVYIDNELVLPGMLNSISCLYYSNWSLAVQEMMVTLLWEGEARNWLSRMSAEISSCWQWLAKVLGHVSGRMRGEENTISYISVKTSPHAEEIMQNFLVKWIFFRCYICWAHPLWINSVVFFPGRVIRRLHRVWWTTLPVPFVQKKKEIQTKKVASCSAATSYEE